MSWQSMSDDVRDPANRRGLRLAVPAPAGNAAVATMTNGLPCAPKGTPARGNGLTMINDSVLARNGEVLIGGAWAFAPEEPCARCGQVDRGQTGEYPCMGCGLPQVWDEA